MRQAFFVCLLCAYIVQAQYQMAMWRSDLALWTRAAAVAPMKPRPALNLGKALLIAGERDAAERAFYRTLALAEASHLPGYDRVDAIGAAQANLVSLLVLDAMSE